MGFVKVGDDVPVINYYDDNLEKVICEECGKPVITAEINDEESKLICECEIKEDD